jgi:hypothetical protein
MGIQELMGFQGSYSLVFVESADDRRRYPTGVLKEHKGYNPH